MVLNPATAWIHPRGGSNQCGVRRRQPGLGDQGEAAWNGGSEGGGMDWGVRGRRPGLGGQREAAWIGGVRGRPVLNSQSHLFCPSSEPLPSPHSPEISDAAFCSDWGVSKRTQCWVLIGGSLQAQCRPPLDPVPSPWGSDRTCHHHSAPDREQEEGMVAHASGALPGKPHQEPKFRPTWIELKGVRGWAGPAEGPGVDGEGSSQSTEGFGAGQG